MPNNDFNQPMAKQVQVHDLGQMSYAAAFKRQQEAQAHVIQARGTSAVSQPTLFLVEHNPPVITMTRRPGVSDHLTALPQQLASAGVEVVGSAFSSVLLSPQGFEYASAL